MTREEVARINDGKAEFDRQENLVWSVANIATFPLAITLSGAACLMLWRWFAVPLLHLPSLSLWAMVGVRLLFIALGRGALWTKGMEVDSKNACIGGFLQPAFTVATGFVVHVLLTLYPRALL